jgi:hypothetical protein
MPSRHSQTQANIERFGCLVMHVSAEEDLPPFAFSVGIEATSNAPEIVVIGLKQAVAHFIVNEYNRRVRAGEVLQPGSRYEGFIEGFDVAIIDVHKDFYSEYFGYNLWYYSGSNFRMLQLVYPNTSGVWPWESEASEWFKKWQPILTY